MTGFESLESVKRKLAGITSEHSARMELATRKLAETDKATAESHKDFVDKQKRVVERLREMAKAQRESAVKKPDSELNFMVEDEAGPDELADEMAALERARIARASQTEEGSFLQAAPSAGPGRWGREPVPATEPVAQAPVRPLPPVRQPPPRRRVADDDDDFGNESYLT
ncbi:hypothetical protein [Umezawaea sp. Da 62-37]|uniref:hypothetical protein n=1 Tax=Umezawaea sp. Da 62-37 TaxID=3075927 RepID=UPI0028F71660|nr:hypothetical protein [Umezawaea sp. Da 62-37]WNV90845.1 hypothetical protein RM788_21965 [Umezawaea sp. Da 62-37]